MINFLIKKDIKDSTLVDTNGKSLIGEGKEKEFLDLANEFYLNEALELRVSEDDIVVYDPNIDTEDLRDYWCKQITRQLFLKLAFSALIKKDGDVYHIKKRDAEKEFNKILSKLSANRIIGNRPATIKTQNSYSTITRHHGDSSYNTNNCDGFY